MSGDVLGSHIKESCYLHLISRSAAKCPTMPRRAPHPQERIIQPQMSIVPRLRNPTVGYPIQCLLYVTKPWSEKQT